MTLPAELRRLAAVEAQAQEPVGEAHSMPGTGGFTMACFSAATVPVGTKLYAAPVEQAAKAVPAGFVLVPVAMTPEMRTALLDYAGPGYVDEECLPRVWSAMLAAAPTPPAPEAQQPAGQEQDERAAFEAWAISYSTIPLKRDDDASLGFTGYTEMDQTMLWDAWQARAALAQRREPLTDEQIAEGRYLTWAAEPDDAPEAWSFLRGARWAEKHFGIGATTGEQQ